jgi:hypothetical protein
MVKNVSKLNLIGVKDIKEKLWLYMLCKTLKMLSKAMKKASSMIQKMLNLNKV